jgi:hypothetical protein
MKRIALVYIALCLLAAPPVLASNTLNAPMHEAIQADAQESICSASAACDGGTTITCEGDYDCSARDRNCSFLQRGYVKCDGVYYWCQPDCDPDCPDGRKCYDDLDCQLGSYCLYCHCGPFESTEAYSYCVCEPY